MSIMFWVFCRSDIFILNMKIIFFFIVLIYVIVICCRFCVMVIVGFLG